MSRNEDTPVLQDGDAEVTGQLQAGTVAVQNKVLAQINNKLAVDGQVLVTEEQRNAINGYAGLDQNGKILAALLPEIGISRVYVVSSQAAQLAITADEGDLVIRSDLSRSFVHSGGTTGTMSDWLELARTSDHVYSVAGRVGAVELNTNDIGGLSSALAGKANASHTHTLADVTDAGTSASKNVAATGDATSGQVVLGNDSRLSDTRDPKAHSHPISDVTNLQSSLDSKSNVGHTHTLSNITNAGTAAAKDAPTTGDATSGQVVLGSDTRLSDSRTPNPHTHPISDVFGLQGVLDTLATANHTHTLSQITDAGTAASKNVPATGNASSTQVVLGSDTRLSDARTPVAHTHPASDITGLDDAITTKQNLSEKNQANGYAGLGADAKLPTSLLPALSISSVSVVADQAAQLALTVQTGDVVVRTDQSKTYIHNGGTAGTMADFTELAVPPDLVQSVAGRTGNISLTISDIENLTTSLANKAGITHKSNHTLVGGSNEVQLLTVAGNDGTGSFTLSFNGQTTAAISVPATTTSVKNALEALSGIGTGNLTVAQFSGQSHVFEITFVNARGRVDQSFITSNGSGITGGGTVYVQSTTPASGSATSLWLNTSDNNTYIWTGTSWTSFGPTPPFETVSGSEFKTLNMTLVNGASGTAGPDQLYPYDIGAAETIHTHTISQVTDAGTAASRNVAASGNASSSQVVKGDDTRLTDARTPTAHKSTHATGGSDALTASDIGAAASSHTHTLSAITDAGTAASKNVATSGNATTSQVVQGNDTRLTSTGLFVWGDNNNQGRLGTGTLDGTSFTATQIASSAFTTVATTSSTSLAIKSDGTLWTWGAATSGQLGNGTTSPAVSLPTQIGSATSWETVEGTVSTVIALRTDGTLWTWGAATNGKLGNGTTSGDISTPTQIGTDTSWTAIAPGANHVLALKSNGTLWSWGLATSGALGNGSTSGTTSTPTQVGTDTDWAAISAGNAFSVAIKTNGALYSWGQAANGKLGNGTTTPDISTPTQVGSATDWSAVSCGIASTLALKTDGTLWSWGTGTNGILGSGAASDITSPTQAKTGAGWTFIAGGNTRSAGVKDGNLYVWGAFNNAGNLPFGPATSTAIVLNTPQQVNPFRNVVSINRQLYTSSSTWSLVAL